MIDTHVPQRPVAALRVRPRRAASGADPTDRRTEFVVQQADAETEAVWRDIAHFDTRAGAETEAVRLDAIRAAVTKGDPN